MDPAQILKCSVGEFLAYVNQTLEFAYPTVEITGEVASFKVNQNKYVFFDLKDENGTVGCFMTVWQLRMPIEDGMKIVVTATPKVTQWGKFSLTVRALRPVGEGNLRKSFELLKVKLTGEGLFATERKRPLPARPERIAVISSTQAAGYADFIKILDDRWGGVTVDVAHVQVQGIEAPQQMIRALEYLNQVTPGYDVIAILRGGGSADDLAAFNDEPLVRAIAASRTPIITGVGHEIDTSLADLAADVAAATPSNAAQLLVPDRQEVVRQVRGGLSQIVPRVLQGIEAQRERVAARVEEMYEAILRRIDGLDRRLILQKQVLQSVDPAQVLARGYALVRGKIVVGLEIEIEMAAKRITAEVKHVTEN